MNRTASLIAGAAILLTGLLLLHFSGQKDDVWNDATVMNATLSDRNIPISVSIARTAAEQSLGLSGTIILPSNAGKLFVFNTPGTYGFWMKDMQYGLDFIWIDSNHRIVEITSNVSPATYPQIFYPHKPVVAVLELNAGFSTAHNFLVGDTLTVKK